MITNKIQTYTGRFIDPANPDPNEISILDIAHALSHMCRFAGHVKRFYSVAQHCVIVSEECNEKDRMWGLLHDACEAYCCDIPRPLKHNSNDVFRFFRDVETKLQAAICVRFGMDMPEPVSVKVADRRSCAAEIRDLMCFGKSMMNDEQNPIARTIVALDPMEAKAQYLERFLELGGKVG